MAPVIVSSFHEESGFSVDPPSQRGLPSECRTTSRLTEAGERQAAWRMAASGLAFNAHDKKVLMSIRATLVAAIPAPIEAIIKFAIYGDPDSPRAVSRKVGRRLPREKIKTAFDVGANVGQSIRALSVAFPGVQVFSFEPDPDTFLQLKAGSFDAKLFNYGFGAEDGLLRFDNSGHNQNHHIAQDQGNLDLPTVRIRRLDEAFSEFGLDEIDYLKIDTEGHDLEVLRGATGLLRDSKIKIVETECGVNRDNKYHVPFADIQNYLEDFGYRLFHIYEQSPEWPTGRPNLRRVNAVFISPVVIERNVRRNV